MEYIYSATGKKIPLQLSNDDAGVLFDAPTVARSAARDLRAGAPKPMTEATARHFGHVMLMRYVDIANEPIRALTSELTSAQARRAKRTLPVYIDPESHLRAIATVEISIRFKPKVSAATRRKLLQSFDLKVKHSNEFSRLHHIVVPSQQPDEWKTVDLANRLSEQPDVAYAAPNFIAQYRKAIATNDPLLAQQWHLSNPGGNGARQGEDVAAPLAWDTVAGGDPGIVIAIVDDGVDLRHPDLKANIWTNPNAGARDRHGRNFYDANYPYDPNPRHFQPPYNEMTGNDIHGTCCAGVAAAVGNNGKGVTGVAYRCKILAVKIFGGDDLATNENVANAIRYAGQHADVISCSWGGVQNPDLESAINDVSAQGRGGKGGLIFCATGNESRSSISYPARYAAALGVGASNDQGKRARYSNYGTDIEFVAPSSDPDRNRQGITTTDVSRKNRGFKLNSAYTDDFGGTSSATPLAAGIAALVLSAKPSLSRDQVRDILRSTADKIDSANGAYNSGYSLQYGYGRLNAHQAVLKAATRARSKASKRRATRSRHR